MGSSHLSPILILVFLISILSPVTCKPVRNRNFLPQGSSLSVEDASGAIQSSDGTFTFGFYNLSSSAFTLSIWFSNSADRTLAWSANRDHPVRAVGSKVTLNKDGSMVLTDFDGTVVWHTNGSSTEADRVVLTDTGNLVVKDQGGSILWQSFDSPTDTLLPTQPITATATLVSTNPLLSPGYYSLRFDDRYILSLVYTGPEISNIYWPNPDLSSWLNYRLSYNRSRRGVLDELGRFLASDNTTFTASDWGDPGIKRRLTLDNDGNLRLYSLDASDGSWSVSWVAFSLLCDIHGLCGWNGICIYSPTPTCSCPPGYEMDDPSDWSKGCNAKFNITCDSSEQMTFVPLPQTDFWGSDMNYIQSTSLHVCEESCMASCSCIAFEYKETSDCYLKSALLNGKTYPGYPGTLYLKLPKAIALSEPAVPQSQLYVPPLRGLVCNASTIGTKTILSETNTQGNGNSKWYYYYGFISALFVIEVCFIVFGWSFMWRKESRPSAVWAREEGYKVIASHFRRYTYKELRRATRKFKDELGRGRFGAVYKGILDDERVVAVKKLKDVEQGEDEFRAELSVIGRIYHMNLVRVWGFCSEGKYRMLVHEYVDNGSLAMFLSGGQQRLDVLLDWKKRYNIAVGVAKGLAYLHHECQEWIIHCDVKPENILLDQVFEPKIGDFGLAKLLDRGRADPNSSKIRGTRGYIAPEWGSSAPITAKVDVYSYGVVLLELVKGVRISELILKGDEAAEMALKRLVRKLREKLESGEQSWIADFVDPRLNKNFNFLQAATMLEVAVSCLEHERSKRPGMNDIVQTFLSSDDESKLTRRMSRQ